MRGGGTNAVLWARRRQMTQKKSRKTFSMTPEPDTGCKLLPGLNGLLIQALLMVVSFMLLVVKKKIEVKYSNRTWSEFMLDSSKQIIGGIWLHILNLLVAVQQHKHHYVGDACDWYWVNIVVDCSVGTAIEYLLFILIMQIILPRLLSERTMGGLHSGDYGGERLADMQWCYYYKQLSVWLLICTSMKFCVVVFMRVCRGPLIALASWVLGRYDEHPASKLFIVMVVTPLLLNTLQLWIIDNILKKSERIVDSDRAHLKSELLPSIDAYPNDS